MIQYTPEQLSIELKQLRDTKFALQMSDDRCFTNGRYAALEARIHETQKLMGKLCAAEYKREYTND